MTATSTWLRHAVSRTPRPAGESARARQVSVALEGARVVFQPIVSIATGSLVAVEALTRFVGPDELPGEAFALAHRAGYGPELEAQCVGAALAQRDQLDSRALVAVNVSPDALQLLTSASFLPADLTGVIIELTEQDITDLDDVTQCLTMLRGHGAAVALDDVGSGYAGLQRVVDIRPDFVKVDRQLVAGSGDWIARTAVLDSLVTLSHRLGAAVIAEGVGDLADLAVLAELDIDYVQGYAIGYPAWPLEPVADDVVRACRAARARVLEGASTGASATRTRGVYAVTAALRAAGDLDDLQTAISAAADELDVHTIGISVLCPDGTLREIAAGRRQIDTQPYPLTDYPSTVEALRTGHSLEIQLDDPTGDPSEQELLRYFGDASLLLVPVLVGGEPLAVVELSHRTPRRWSSADIAYVHGLAALLAPLLTRANLTEGAASN